MNRGDSKRTPTTANHNPAYLILPSCSTTPWFAHPPVEPFTITFLSRTNPAYDVMWSFQQLALFIKEGRDYHLNELTLFYRMMLPRWILLENSHSLPRQCLVHVPSIMSCPSVPFAAAFDKGLHVWQQGQDSSKFNVS